jgi:hypothetical protein
MRIIPEVVSVFADPLASEVNVVISGFRISLTADESTLLLDGLIASLERLRATQKATNSTPEGWRIERHADGSVSAPGPTAHEPASEFQQQQNRASVQAAIRTKGLSLREE